MNEMQQKYINAVKALLEHELSDHYSADEHVPIYDIDEDNVVHVQFPDSVNFYDIEIKVAKFDHEDLEYSDFKIRIYEDNFVTTCAYNFTIKELWKCLLWKP